MIIRLKCLPPSSLDGLTANGSKMTGPVALNLPTDEVFLTTEEVLAYLQVNLRTVYRLIKAGKIPALRSTPPEAAPPAVPQAPAAAPRG